MLTGVQGQVSQSRLSTAFYHFLHFGGQPGQVRSGDMVGENMDHRGARVHAGGKICDCPFRRPQTPAAHDTVSDTRLRLPDSSHAGFVVFEGSH